jgi:hypothetical protein
VGTFGYMLDRLVLPALPVLRGQRVVLRGFAQSDADDRLRHPIDPEEEDGYGSSWRREWDGERYHTLLMGLLKSEHAAQRPVPYAVADSAGSA